MSSNSSNFRNPDTYLNHLSPSKGARFEFNRNIYLSILQLGATIWDVLVYIPDDISILRRDVGIVALCFVFSRVFTIAFLILGALLYIHPFANCQAMDMSSAIVNDIGGACAAVLFLRRVQAVYFDNRIVQRVFFCLWLIYIGTLAAIPFGLHGSHLRHTSYCITDDKKDFIIGSKISTLLFDSLVFFAVSYRIARPIYSGHRSGLTFGTFISGKALSRFSRAILQGGQQYYLLMVIVNLVNIIVLYIDEASAYRAMFTPFSSALGASMGCRVYRNIKLFEEKDRTIAPPIISAMNFARDATPIGTSDRRLGENHAQNHSDPNTSTVASRNLAEGRGSAKELKLDWV